VRTDAAELGQPVAERARGQRTLRSGDRVVMPRDRQRHEQQHGGAEEALLGAADVQTHEHGQQRQDDGRGLAVHRERGEDREGRSAPPTRPLRKTHGLQQRREHEQAREHVLAAADPRDGLAECRMREEARAGEPCDEALCAAREQQPHEHRSTEAVQQQRVQVRPERRRAAARVVEPQRRVRDRQIRVRDRSPRIQHGAEPLAELGIVGPEEEVVVEVQEPRRERRGQVDEQSEAEHRHDGDPRRRCLLRGHRAWRGVGGGRDHEGPHSVATHACSGASSGQSPVPVFSARHLHPGADDVVRALRRRKRAVWPLRRRGADLGYAVAVTRELPSREQALARWCASEPVFAPGILGRGLLPQCKSDRGLAASVRADARGRFVRRRDRTPHFLFPAQPIRHHAHNLDGEIGRFPVP
jgi:hypothetical protein